MTGTQIINKAYRLTNKASTTFLDGDSDNVLAELNTLYGHRVLDVIRLTVDKNATINEAYTDLISTSGLSEGNNGYNGEYAFPSDLLRPVRVEVSYDGENWKKCEVYDSAENTRSEFDDEQLANTFSTARPKVNFVRNSFKIRPPKNTAGNITNGIYIEYEQRQSDLASAAASPSQIESNIQDILAYDLAELEYIMHADKYSEKQYTVFMRKKAEVEVKFRDFYKNRFKGNKRVNVKYNNYN